MVISQQLAQSIVNEMKRSIHRDINIMDETGMIIASTDPKRAGTEHAGAVTVLREKLDSLTIGMDASATGVRPGVNLPVSIDGQVVGVIGITGEPEEVSAFGDIIRRMTELMIENARNKEQTQLQTQAKRLFLENWLFENQPDWEELGTRGRLLGLDICAPYRVVLLNLGQPEGVSQDGSQELRSGLVLRLVEDRIAGNPRHYCALIRNRIILLLCCTERGEAHALVRELCREIREQYLVWVGAGISSPSETPADLRQRYLEAKAALTVAAGRNPWDVAFYDEASLDFIAGSIPPSIRQDLKRLVFSDCTQREQEEFIGTIRLYFQCDGDLKRCAERLYVHRNTVQYRIECIRKKTGYDLRTPRGAALLYLAC